MSEVTKEDLHQVHNRIDDLVEITTQVRLSVVRIEASIPKQVEFPGRPCQPFLEHIAEHKENVKTWKSSAIRSAVDILKMIIVAAAVYFFARKD